MFIHQAAHRALEELGTPTHVSAIYRYMIEKNYYDFGAKNPENALAIQLSRRSCNVFIGDSIAEKIFYRAAPATYGLVKWLEVANAIDVPRSLSSLPVESDIHEILHERKSSTERETFLLARIGQGTFRDGVLKQWNNRCAITGASIAVRASHIKPWRASSDAERLDPNNGLPLVATLDALFDVYLISFERNGRIILGSKISKLDRQCLGIDNKMMLRRCPSIETEKYLRDHREKIDSA